MDSLWLLRLGPPNPDMGMVRVRAGDGQEETYGYTM